MRCPACGHDRWHTLDGRHNARAYRRRKRCDACARVYTTYERIATQEQVTLSQRHKGFDCCGARTILKGIHKQLEEELSDETTEESEDG